MENNIIVVTDTREQQPWDFSFYGYEQKIEGCKTGDYTLVGYEDVLSIERKKTTGELALNLGSKKFSFYAELKRMKSFKYRYLILEFSEQTVLAFPEDSGIPPHARGKLRMNGKFMLSCLQAINDKFDIPVIFAGSRDNAINEAITIFNKVINDNDDGLRIF